MPASISTVDKIFLNKEIFLDQNVEFSLFVFETTRGFISIEVINVWDV